MTSHLAQANLSRLRLPPDEPGVAEVLAATDRINHLADRAPGFVWRLRTHLDDPRLILNISLWRSYPHLHEFVYRSAHNHYVRRRDEWFERVRQPSTVLWWVETDTRPSAEDALRRLALLRSHGPSPRAFSVRVRFDQNGRREPDGRKRT